MTGRSSHILGQDFLPSRRHVLVWAGAGVLCLTGLFGSGSAHAADAIGAEAFVRQSIDRGYAILNNTSLSDDQRRAQFRQFMLGLTDTRRIALFTLGPYVNRASKDEVENFVQAFTDYAVAVYEARLGKYKGQTLKVTGSQQRSADDVIVTADVVNPAEPNGPVYKASFRVRRDAGGRMIVTDLQIEGIWLALSQRSDFTGFLQQHNGRIADLIGDLKRQTDMLHSGATQARAG
jgi:phospholipid transport system substrate-binding protein